MDQIKEFSERGGWWVVAQATLLVVAVALPLLSSMSGGFGQPVTNIGFTIFFVGLVLALAGVISLGRSMTPFPRPHEKGELVTTGTYRFMRHPIYAAVVLIVFGWSLMWSSPVGLALTILVAVFLNRKAAREERWMRARFRDYANYERNVRRFIPRF